MVQELWGPEDHKSILTFHLVLDAPEPDANPQPPKKARPSGFLVHHRINSSVGLLEPQVGGGWFVQVSTQVSPPISVSGNDMGDDSSAVCPRGFHVWAVSQ